MPDETTRQGPAGTASDGLEEAILRRVPWEVLGLTAALAAAALAVFGHETALAFFSGGALAALGFLWLRHALTRFLSRDRTGAVRSGLFLYGLRLVLICGVFLFIILLFPKLILAFGAGFSVVIPVFLAEGARGLWRMKTWKA
jgi:hypothetical protein